MFGFPFEDRVGFVWDEIPWFASFLEVWTLDEKILESGNNYVAYQIFLSLLVIVFLNVLYVIISFYRGHIRYSFYPVDFQSCL
jgi:hypothetical protein